jgi:formate dehydrogenase accessory protein FdhD
MSLQEASASLTRLARYDVGVVAELPEESSLRIEVNGVLAGVVHCLPDAPSELAVGWAFMHGFFGLDDPVDSVSVHEGRVSIMVESGQDIDQRRLEAVGWRGPDAGEVAESVQRPAPFAIHADVLVDLVREAVKVMASDRSRDGFVHAAIASDSAIHCVARDYTVEMAVAKVLGWLVSEGDSAGTPIMIVRGMIDQNVVRAAGLLGMSLIITTGIPTANAFREATGRELTILGMATNQRPGLLVDAGHVVEDDNVS